MLNTRFAVIIAFKATMYAIMMVAFSHNSFSLEVPKICVVDVQKVIENSIFVQNLKKSIAEVKKEVQHDLQKKELELKALERSLVDQKGKLSDVDLKRKSDEFKQRLTDTQRIAQEAKHFIDQEYASQMQKILEDISHTVKNIATDHSVDIVLSSAHQVLYAKQNLDLTDLVIKKLNSKITSSKISKPKYKL